MGAKKRKYQFPDGEMTTWEAEKRYGISRTTISTRLKHGWTPEDAVTKPVGQSVGAQYDALRAELPKRRHDYYVHVKHLESGEFRLQWLSPGQSIRIYEGKWTAEKWRRRMWAYWKYTSVVWKRDLIMMRLK